MFRKINWKIALLSLLAVVTILIWYAVYRTRPTNILEVAIMDVGQGDAIYIKAPNGNEVLIDGGPNRSVLTDLGELMPFWDRSIDLVLLTHPHLDHLEGLIEVLKRYEVGSIIEADPAYNNPAFPLWHEEIKDEHIPDLVARSGEVITLAPQVTLTILEPSKSFVEAHLANVHDSMVVAKLTYASTSVLLTGDMEAPLEEELIASGADLHADVLKVGHHGSKTSTSEDLLKAVQPKLAVISVGAHNTYGHPTKEILDRLTRYQIPILRTDTHGTIILKSDGHKISVE